MLEEFLPKFGINTRYTVYDIKDEDNDSDIEGDFFSMPLFTLEEQEDFAARAREKLQRQILKL